MKTRFTAALRPIAPAIFRPCGLVAMVLAVATGMTIPCRADDSQTAEQLKTLGSIVTIADGVVTDVMFRNSRELNDSTWELIGGLSGLKKLTVFGGAHSLNDQTVSQLLRLKSLESLSTDGAQLSDAGLETLAGVTSLRSAAFFHLSFRMEGFTGTGFAAWKDMPHMENLTVAGMSMGDEGFKAISQIRTLKAFRTWHTYQTETGNEFIAKLPNLISLRVGQRLPRGAGVPASLSDASIPTLTQIRTLETLEIGEAALSVDALRQLKSLPKLKRVLVYTTELNEADIEELRKSLPGVKVDFDPITEDQRTKLRAYLK